MTRRLYCPAGACAAFAVVVGLVGGGLGWVTVASLRVEADQQASAMHAERAGLEGLALWRLDGQILPALGVENNRPFAHYAVLYSGFPAVDTNATAAAPWSLQLPSPLLSADIPPWMPLHFSLAAGDGWTSPQVVSPELADTLSAPPINLPLGNATEARRDRLADLRRRFPAAAVVRALTDNERQTPASEPFVVPYPQPDEPSAVKPGSLTVADHRAEQDAPATAMPRPTALAPNEPVVITGTNPSANGPNFNYRQRPAADWADRFWPEFFEQDGADASSNPPARSETEKKADELNRYAGQGQRSNLDEYQNRQQLAQQVFNQRGGYEVYGNTLKNGFPNVPQTRSSQAAGPPPATPEPPAQQSAVQSEVQDKLQSPTDQPSATSKGRGLDPDEAAKDREAAKQDADSQAEPGQKANQLAAVVDPRIGREKPGRSATERLTSVFKESADSGWLGEPSVGRAVSFGVAPGESKPPPTVRPTAVHVGPLRAVWLTATDGGRELVFVRAARLADRTVYQGVLLDWPLLQSALKDQIADLLPAASLLPADGPATDAPPERGMTALPVVLDPGPLPPAPGVGRSPLRVGLALAWTAALVALLAVGVGGYSLVSLSERRIRFVSAVTHELRTPLTSLRLYLDLLTSGMIDDEAKKQEYLTTLAAESERLNRLIENVLDFASLEKRTISATLRPTPVGGLIGQVRATWADRCTADGKDLVVAFGVPEDSPVHTDLRIAAQVVGNLVDNARKYSRDAADPRIWLRTVQGGGGRVVIEVEDRGPGVPARERGSIFRAFRRGRAADTVAGGAGLGLALARQWAEAVGGRLSYRSGDDGGACFRLELPTTG